MPEDTPPPEVTPEITPEARPAVVEPRDADLVPRPSKMRYLAMIFAGMLIGRIASANFGAGALNALDLVMYIGLALSLAWAWRSWARRAMVQRHLDAERRRSRTSPPTRRPKKR